jgi:hypothetical protein
MQTAANPYERELELLAKDLGGQSQVAKLLDVDRSCMTRWVRRHEIPDTQNQTKIVALHLVLLKLKTLFLPETAEKWLRGINAHLANHRPMDLIREGRIAEVLGALEQAETGAYA